MVPLHALTLLFKREGSRRNPTPTEFLRYVSQIVLEAFNTEPRLPDTARNYSGYLGSQMDLTALLWLSVLLSPSVNCVLLDSLGCPTFS